MKVSGRHPGAVFSASSPRTGDPLSRRALIVRPSVGPVGRCPKPKTADSPRLILLLTARGPQTALGGSGRAAPKEEVWV
jgi:hypothetical protein